MVSPLGIGQLAKTKPVFIKILVFKVNAKLNIEYIKISLAKYIIKLYAINLFLKQSLLFV